MIELKLVGFEKIEYTKKDGTEVKGSKLHVMYEGDEYENCDNVTGKAVESIYIGAAIVLPALKIGDNLQIRYNRRGFVQSIKVVEAGA